MTRRLVPFNISLGGIPGPLTVESEGFFRGPFIKMNRLLFHWNVGGGYPQHISNFGVVSIYLRAVDIRIFGQNLTLRCGTVGPFGVG